jgi:hypothetical protein
MKKLNKLIAGITIAAALLAGASQFGQASKESATIDQPATSYSIISDPGGGGGH